LFSEIEERGLADFVALFQSFRGRFVSFNHLCEHLFNPLFRQPWPLAKRLY
jgi:hypothetical protein